MKTNMKYILSNIIDKKIFFLLIDRRVISMYMLKPGKDY